MSDTKTYRAISVKLAAFLCREKWSDELPEKTRKEMQRLVKEWQDVDRDHKPSDTTTERPWEAISPRLVKHYKQATHQIGDLFTWCVEHMRGMQFGPDSADWIDQIKNRLLTFTTIEARLAEVEAERDRYRKSAELRLGVFTKATDYCRLAEQRAEAAEALVKELERKTAWAENAEEMNGVVLRQVELIRQNFNEEFKPLGNDMWRMDNIGEACRVIVAAEAYCPEKDNAADCEHWSAMYAKLADELVAVKAKLDLVTSNYHTMLNERFLENSELRQRAEAAEMRMKQLLDALRLCKLYGSQGDIDDGRKGAKSVSYYVDKAIDAAEAALATTPPAGGAQS